MPISTSATPKDSKFTNPMNLNEDQLSSILNTSKILHLVHHRNSNQHRRSHWYTSFSIFRRHLKHLLHDLTITSSLPPTMLPSRKREITKVCEGKVERRLEIWKRVYVKKWFGDFSQLMADNQFAVLALVLLGCLGRVCFITGVTEAIEKSGEEQEDVGAALKEYAKGKAAKEVDGLLGVIEDRREEHDTGVVIAREDDDDDEGETVSRPGDEVPSEDGESISRATKQKLSSTHQINTKQQKRKTQESPAETPTPQKTKKKRSKKKDAIDDLFNNLI